MNEETTTKSDLADSVYDSVGGFSKRECTDLVDSFFEVMKDTLATGEKIKLSGFGNFEVRYKKPRLGRNPLTGEEIMISARHVVTFKASPVLKDFVNSELGRPKFKQA